MDRADCISPSEITEAWDRLAVGHFEEAPIRDVKLDDGTVFKALHLPRREPLKPHLAWQTGLSFVAFPRFAAYRHRLVLVPADVFANTLRWHVSEQDIEDLIFWSDHMQHVVTVSTLKSGASSPLEFHAQSFPLKRSQDTCLSALPGVEASLIVDRGSMPQSLSMRIEQLRTYPLRGLKLTGERAEVARKSFELALNYDDLKSFNIVILPNELTGTALYFFPRRKDGVAIYKLADRRWQIAALEANGLMQAKTAEDAALIDKAMILDIFRTTGLDADEFEVFLRLLESF